MWANRVSEQNSLYVQEMPATFRCLSCSLRHIEHMPCRIHVRKVQRKLTRHCVRKWVYWPVPITARTLQRAHWKIWPKAKRTIQQAVTWAVHEPILYPVLLCTFNFFLLIFPLRFYQHFLTFAFSVSCDTIFRRWCPPKRNPFEPKCFDYKHNSFSQRLGIFSSQKTTIKRTRYKDI